MSIVSHDSEVPARGQQVITASAFLHQEFDSQPKVFLAQRASTKKFLPGVYELPGGHVDFGEDPVAGLQREIHEEFEMDITVGDPFYVFTYTNPVKGSHSIEVVYFARFSGSTETISLNPDDHAAYGWFGEQELQTAMTSIKGADDPEFIAIRKGFALLKGSPPQFF